MIIWSRWGIFVLLFAGAGAGIGFLIQALAGISQDSGSTPGMFVGIGLMIGAVGLYFFVKHVVDKHLDKARPLFLTQPLAQPIVHPNGIRQTHEQVPVLHPQTGQQMWSKPTSTFFFVPVRFWPFVLGGIGVVAFLVGLVGTLAQ